MTTLGGGGGGGGKNWEVSQQISLFSQSNPNWGSSKFLPLFVRIDPATQQSWARLCLDKQQRSSASEGKFGRNKTEDYEEIAFQRSKQQKNQGNVFKPILDFILLLETILKTKKVFLVKMALLMPKIYKQGGTLNFWTLYQCPIPQTRPS